jgi:spermidine/putrescine transport system permease protein
MAAVPTAAPVSGNYTRRPGWGAWLFMSPLLLWLLLFVIVPTVMIVVYSFGTKNSLGEIQLGFTWDNYLRALDWDKLQKLPTTLPANIEKWGFSEGIAKTFNSFLWLKIFLLSIWYAFLTTVICMVVGYPVAYFIGRAPLSVRNLLLTLVMIPFWTSFLIRTYAWISLLSRDGLLNGLLLSFHIIPEPLVLMYTPFAVVLGLVYNFLPFMILPIYTSVERLDNAMVEAAYDLGAGPVRAFSQVIIPLTRPGIVAGALLVFVPSIAMFAITTLMGGGKVPTIGEVIQKQFTTARNPPFGSALGTILLLIFIISLWLTRRQREE